MCTRTRSSAETELRAQVAGFLGLPLPASPTCAETATRSVRFAPSITRLRRTAAAGTPGTNPVARLGPRPAPQRPAQLRAGGALPTAPSRTRRASPARKCAPHAEKRFRTRPLRRSVRRQLRPCRRGHRPAAGLTFAEQRQQQQQPSQPRGAGCCLRHRPCALGPRREGRRLDQEVSGQGAALSRAVPSRLERGDTADAERRERLGSISGAVRRALVAGLRRS